MEIKIFNSYRGEDNFIINWQPPNYFLNWFVKNFSGGNLKFQKQKLDVSLPAFKDLLEFLDSKPNAFSISSFFNVKSDVVTKEDIENFFRSFNEDVDRLLKRKMIGMTINKMTNEEVLTSRLKFQVCEDISDISDPIVVENTLNGQIVHIGKRSIDHGYGKKERYLHDAEYFLDLSIRIFGVPLKEDEIVLDIRPEFLETYDCQRISQKQLKIFENKNKGKKIVVALRYLESADGWKFGFTIVDKKQIIEQLEF